MLIFRRSLYITHIDISDARLFYFPDGLVSCAPLRPEHGERSGIGVIWQTDCATHDSPLRGFEGFPTARLVPKSTPGGIPYSSAGDNPNCSFTVLPPGATASFSSAAVGSMTLNDVVDLSSPAAILTRSTLMLPGTLQSRRRTLQTIFFSRDRNSRRWCRACSADAAMAPGRTPRSSHHGCKLHVQKFSIFSRCSRCLTTSTSTIHHVSHHVF